MKRSKPTGSLKNSKPNTLPRKRQTEREFLELQRLMAGTVMQPLGADGGMRAKWRDGRAMKKVAAEFVKSNDRLTSFERLEIYNRQYWFRIKDCFYEDYPGLRAILGEEKFEKLALAYLEKNPSQSFTLRNLGRGLVKFLQANPRWIKPLQKPALDMARLEWAHVEAFDNEAKEPLQVDSLLGVDPAQIRLEMQPHLTLLKLGYELDEFLIKQKQGEGLRSEASNAMEQKTRRKRGQLKRHLRPKATFIAVHRHNNTVYYKRLQEPQFLLLTSFQSGRSIADACAALAEGGFENLSEVQSWFQTWASLGWFCQSE
jgi:hypothetical protein